MSSEEEWQDSVEGVESSGEEYEEPVKRSRKRQRRAESVGTEAEEPEEPETPGSGSDADYGDLGMRQRLARKAARCEALAKEFARTMLGLEAKHQVLNKNYVSKVLEAAGEKGAGVQFKRDLLERTRVLFSDTFGMDIVALEPAAEDYILKSTLGDNMKAKVAATLRQYTHRIDGVSDLEDATLEHGATLVRMTETLPKPATDLAQDGLRSLILTTVLLRGNNVLQRDLLRILDETFHLRFKETQQYSLLGNQTIAEFLRGLVLAEYLRVNTPASSKKQQRQQRRPTKGDDSALIFALGRRTLIEFDRQAFLNIIKDDYDTWDDRLEARANRSLDLVFPRLEEHQKQGNPEHPDVLPHEDEEQSAT